MNMKNGMIMSLVLLSGCTSGDFDPDSQLDYCVARATQTARVATDPGQVPNAVVNGREEWSFTRPGSWTCGFWPGILWYLHEYTGDQEWRERAERFTAPVIPAATGPARSHDVGFMAFPSIGNGYRLTGNPAYKRALIQAADSLARLFNPRVGTFLSWPNMVSKMDWPHNTIIDNMMNLELLFWAAKNGGSRHLHDIAFLHAETTMKHHFREDGSAYHVIVYDDRTGERLKGVTHQGYADETTWARGQAWAVYGFTMAYRESRDPRFLDVARRAADVFLERLPADGVPYWDFDAPGIPDEPRDASAAAIVASALLELSGLVDDDEAAGRYTRAAVETLRVLSSGAYRGGEGHPAFLLHCVGHMPNGSEVDASIAYADYYYLEALIRLKKIREGKSIHEKL
jgi:unsaturated chondroitin disaccharide hydrolase